MLQLRQASYRVGAATLVENIDLALRPGAVVALVGPNGAGKSTMLRLLAGEIAPTRGHAELDGAPIATMDAAALARRRAVLPQHTATSFGFDALAIVLMGRHGPDGGGAGAAAAADALAVMDELGVADLAHRDIRTLSGGEQQRVHLARTLWQVRAFPDNHLLLDEPTSSLDIAHQFDALETARAEARRGTAVLVVLHDLNLAARFADSITVAKGGRIVAQGTAEAILEPRAISDWFGMRAVVTPHPAEHGPMVVFCGRS
jgi:iron complex transport system ATP-binding protein